MIQKHYGLIAQDSAAKFQRQFGTGELNLTEYAFGKCDIDLNSKKMRLSH